MEYTAYLKNLRMSQRKVQDVARVVKNLSVTDAVETLSFLPRRAADPLRKLINSAAAGAKHNYKTESDKLYVKDLRVDPGRSYKRYRPRAMGRSNLILKRTSHVKVVLAERKQVNSKNKNK
jgi:large subunit ribosomal protein L22